MPGMKRPAPDLPGELEWFNVAEPVMLSALRGRVVLLAAGAFSSPVFIQSLSAVQRLGYRFRDDLEIVCVHVPVFQAERQAGHVSAAISRHDVKFPVVHDPGHALCRLLNIGQLPAYVLIDSDGTLIGSMPATTDVDGLEKIIAHRLSLRGVRPAASVHRPALKRAFETPAMLHYPGRLLIAQDRIYLSDSGRHRILVTSLDGHVLRQYGGEGQGFIDGIGDSAAFNQPQGMAISDGFLFVADTGNHALRRINLRTDEVETLAGNGKPADGSVLFGAEPVQMSLHTPTDIVCRAGRLFISMTGLHQIWVLSLTRNTLERFSGSGQAGLADGNPATARFDQPGGLTLCGGRLYCVDAGASAVRCIDPDNGYVTTLVGSDPYASGYRDGKAREARLQYPLDIKCDEAQQMLWVADTYNNRVRRIGIRSGMVTGMMLDRHLDEPCGLAFANDTLYIANTNAHEILRVNPDNGHADALDVIDSYS